MFSFHEFTGFPGRRIRGVFVRVFGSRSYQIKGELLLFFDRGVRGVRLFVWRVLSLFACSEVCMLYELPHNSRKDVSCFLGRWRIPLLRQSRHGILRGCYDGSPKR